MVMPALVYSAKPHETARHFRYVANHTNLPVMVYNNPPIYKNDVTPDILISLADCENIVCFKDGSGDTVALLTCVIGLAIALPCSLAWMMWYWKAWPPGHRADLRHVERIPKRGRNHLPPVPAGALSGGYANL